MKAIEQLNYLIHALEELVAGKNIDIEEFAAVCRDDEARAELKEVLKGE